MNKTYKKTVWKSFIEGVNNYKLLEDGDRIAVLLSNDYNSLLAVLLLEELCKHGKVHVTPVVFSIIPEKIYNQLQRNTTIIPVDTEEEFYCRLKEEQCNKVVETIYFEEVAEHIVMQLLHHGCINTILPKEKGKDGPEVIRPLYLVKEEHIRQWEEGLSKEISCFFRHKKELNGLIRELNDRNPKIIKNIVRSMENVNLETIISYQTRCETIHFLDRYDSTDL